MMRVCNPVILCVFFLLLGSFVSCEHVTTLTKGNFDDFINQEIALVEFYAPWCGHCKNLAPNYEEAAGIMKTHTRPVPFGKVDATVETELAERVGMQGYPTLKIYRSGKAYEYDGPRDTSGIVKYMKKQAAPSSLLLLSEDDVEAMLGKLEVSVIGFFKEGSSLHKFFEGYADELRGPLQFGHTFSESLMKKYKATKNSIVVFHPKVLNHKWEKNRVDYTEGADKQAFSDFLKEAAFPTVSVLTKDNLQFFSSKKPILTAFTNIDYEVNPKQSNYYRNRILKVARNVAAGLHFSVASKKEFQASLNDLGPVASKEVIVVLETAEQKKFVMEADFSPETLQKFIDDYFEGTLLPFIKSEPEPASNDGPVTILTGRNFERLVMESDKDMLIEFYAPWCGHCKSLAPKYEELGAKLKGNKNLMIAKMDATANDFPANLFEVKGFPTIYWVSADKKNPPEAYNGGREVDDFVSYIQVKSSTPITVNGKTEGKKSKKSNKDEL